MGMPVYIHEGQTELLVVALYRLKTSPLRWGPVALRATSICQPFCCDSLRLSLMNSKESFDSHSGLAVALASVIWQENC